MSSPEPRRSLPPAEEVAARLETLTKLRWRMIELHAQLEFLRLMMRLNATKPTAPRG